MSSNILFFDGVCSLCNGTVDFLIKRDTKSLIKYAPLQSKTAFKLLGEEFTKDLNTVVLYQNGKVFTRSSAILKTLILLGSWYKIFNIFFLLPEFIRDFFYILIAKNRYRLFGKKDTCRLPSPAERELFLD